MKHYIFLCNTICRIGGAELYISRKVQHLEKHGWTVNVFFCDNIGDILIKSLNDYKDNYVPELKSVPSIVSKKKRQAIIERLTREITIGEDVFIESTKMQYALWGELIAEKFKGTSILYLIDETFRAITPKMAEFLNFKLDQNLLYAIDDRRIPLILGDSVKTRNRGLLAVGCSNGNVEDIECEEIDKISDDSLVILSVGRLEKDYLYPSLLEVVAFVNRNSSKTFCLLVIGDTTDKKIKDRIHLLLEGISNLQVIYLGYKHPIPRVILNRSDVAFASAGSVKVPFQEGVVTISIDCKDYKAIGLFGINTMSNISRKENEPQLSLAELLDDVLIKKKYISTHISNENKVNYEAHDKLLSLSQSRYFDALIDGLTKYESIKKILLKFGNYDPARNIISRMVHNII